MATQQLQATIGRIEEAAVALQIKPNRINGIAHYYSDDVESIREALASVKARQKGN